MKTRETALAALVAVIAPHGTAIAAGTWRILPAEGAPSPRYAQELLWTGDRLVVLGGVDASSHAVEDGGIYDPATQTWTRIPSAGSNLSRIWALSWAAGRLIVWRNAGPGKAPGDVYSPATRTWSPIRKDSAINSMISTEYFASDRGVLVMGYSGGCNLRFYRPDTDQWDNPSPHAVLQDGQCPASYWDIAARRLVLWGASTAAVYDAGTSQWKTIARRRLFGGEIPGEVEPVGGKWFVLGRVESQLASGVYDPASGTWTSAPPRPLPAAHFFEQSFLPLTDHSVFNWGTAELRDQGARLPYAEGLIYDATLGRWRSVTREGAPAPRLSPMLAVLRPGVAVVFGGDRTRLDGALYHAERNTWERIAAPQGYTVDIEDTSAVWMGSGFLLWGGGLHRTEIPGFRGFSNEGLWLDL